MTAKSRLEGFQAQAEVNIKTLKKKLVTIAMLRLGVVLAAGLSIYFAWGITMAVWLISLVTVGLFLVLVKRHAAAQTDLKIERAFLQVCSDELKYLGGDWREKNDGREHIDAAHPYSSDLNIFGRHSIFQFLDRTETKWAQNGFAESLKQLNDDPAQILERREAIQELSEDPEFVLRILSKARFLEVDLEFFDSINEWAKEKVSNRSLLQWQLLLYGVPLFTIAATTAYALDFLGGNALMLSFLVPGYFVLSKQKRHLKLFADVSRLLSQVSAFEKMLTDLRAKDFHSKLLQKKMSEIDLATSKAGIKSLEHIVGAMESRNNVLMAIFLNLYAMWDYRCLWRMEKWKENHGAHLADWLRIGLEIEALAPWALYTFGHSDFAEPQFAEDDTFELTEARHVLMDHQAVPNSLSLSAPHAFSIITGANMAGKSTYLRTVGTSIVLAMNGVSVPAASFVFKPRALFTSMLSADSLGDNESYFFNELKRLRILVDLLESGRPQFVILDEILKGTNSVDKAEGARKFLRKLLTLPAKGLVATHDLSLCELVDDYPTQLSNAKFEVNYAGDELLFEYKLESGICQNMNANFLLNKMGLVIE